MRSSLPTSASRFLAGLALAAPMMLGATDCGFADPAAIVPSYTCHSTSDCAVGTCVADVCTEASAVGYSLILRLENGGSALARDSSEFTLDPMAVIETGEQDLTLPIARDVVGTIRFQQSYAIETQIAFRRTTPVVDLIDQVRAMSPMPYATDPGGEPIDYRARVPSSVAYDMLVAPTASPTPGASGIPTEFVGRPLADVFPPVVVRLDASGSDVGKRVDVDYAATLFQPCDAASATACTVVGRLVSTAAVGLPAPEGSVAIAIENEAGVVISTVATTADDGSFSLRLSDPSKPMRIHLGATTERPTYPDLVLDVGAYDPKLGGELEVPRFDTVRFEGRVELQDSLVADAVVRAVATEIYDEAGVIVPGATFELNVRSTDVTAADGAGLFALNLVRGRYDILASEDRPDSSLVHSSVLVSPPAGATPQRGQTFVLGPSWHLDGIVRGPDGTTLPYVTVEGIPARPIVATGSADAYARLASTTGDAGGRFDLSADRGVYDLVFSLPVSEGLPTLVLPNLAVGAIELTDTKLAFPLPVAIFGVLRDFDGTPRPGAKVSAYYYRPETNVRRATVIRLGEATADSNGHYRLLVPSRSSNF